MTAGIRILIDIFIDMYIHLLLYAGIINKNISETLLGNANNCKYDKIAQHNIKHGII